MNGRQERDVLKRRYLSYKRIRELAAEYVIYNDGSEAEGTLEGGAGVVVTFGEPDDPNVVDTLKPQLWTCRLTGSSIIV